MSTNVVVAEKAIQTIQNKSESDLFSRLVTRVQKHYFMNDKDNDVWVKKDYDVQNLKTIVHHCSKLF